MSSLRQFAPILVAAVVVALTLGLLVKWLSDFGRDIDTVTHQKGRRATGG